MSVITKTKKTYAADRDYLDLARRFPPRPLRSAGEHKAAIAIATELMKLGDERLTDGQADYLAALGHFVADYEREAILAQTRDAAPLEVLLHLMEARGMRPADLGEVFGSRTGATMVLRGQREMSKSQIRSAAEFFHVSPAIFL